MIINKLLEKLLIHIKQIIKLGLFGGGRGTFQKLNCNLQKSNIVPRNWKFRKRNKFVPNFLLIPHFEESSSNSIERKFKLLLLAQSGLNRLNRLKINRSLKSIHSEESDNWEK